MKTKIDAKTNDSRNTHVIVKNYQIVDTYRTAIYGYGYFKTYPIKKLIQQPIAEDEQLLLIEDDLFLVTSTLFTFKYYLASLVKRGTITSDYQDYCIESLEKVGNQLFAFTRYLPYDESLFDKYIRAVITQAVCFVYDKRQQAYTSIIDCYKTIDHPAPLIGTIKECFASNDADFYSFLDKIF